MISARPTPDAPEFSLNQLDLNLLRVFDAIMRERNVTKAADRIGRTQPSVSHALNRLRDIFEDELFLRVGGEMEPTPRALELSLTISKSLSDIRQAIERHLRFDPMETQRSFILCVSDYSAIVVLPNLIKSFAERAPNASLNVIHAQNFEVAKQLKQKEIDCAVVGDYKTQDAHISEHLLSEDKMLCAGWKENPRLGQMSLGEFLKSQHLQISSDGRSQGMIDRALEGLGLERKKVATAPHYLMIPFILEGTEMLTAFGDGMLLALSEDSSIRVFEPPIRIPPLQLKLLYESGTSPDPGREWFLGLIKEVVGLQDNRKKALYRLLLAS
ncbi:LysR family transcriptional regulator [Leisingera sp. ANG-DT]|uniref:LysR family transcriptional regulator n=1 Tax=Leisingera sp. ANG-DT TaxID=1577897 RepID=UPI00057CB743|nr:LysR family transcriptional regulator [Leisingera sp. ANG-DT]KIC15699.1 LysR family transcriptional regulator [Leisingera sp. ANG-DT]